jgi:hypothetical protein
MGISITLDSFWSHDHDIHTNLAGQMTGDRSRDPMAVELAPFDDQQINVAVARHRSASR